MHDDSCLLSISIANEKDEKEAGEATGLQSAVNRISFPVAGSLSAVGRGAAGREARPQPRG